MDKKKKINFIRNKQGSTLVWAMVVLLVLGLMIAAGLAISQAYSQRAVTQHIQQQSYYTAFSVTKTMAEWLQGASMSSSETEGVVESATTELNEQQKFIKELSAAPNGTLTKNVEIGTGDMGTCTTTFKMSGDGNILISSVADYEGQNSTVSVTLESATNLEVVEGETIISEEWWDNPPYVIPDPRGAATVSRDITGPVMVDGKLAEKVTISGNVEAKGNFSLNGYLLIPKGSTFTISASQLSIDQNPNFDFVFNAAGTFEIASNGFTLGGKTKGSMLVSGGTIKVTGKTCVFNGPQFVDKGGTLDYNNQTTQNGDIYLYAGGTLNSDATINGDIYVQDGAKLNLKSGTINGNIFVYRGANQSTITISNSVKTTAKTGLWFMGPSETGDRMPVLTGLAFNQTNFAKKVHVKDVNYINSAFPASFPATIYCTGSKTALCEHEAPLMPAVGEDTGHKDGSIYVPGQSGSTTIITELPDTTITTNSWSIGAYSNDSIK